MWSIVESITFSNTVDASLGLCSKKIVGSSVLWTCKMQGTQHKISMKKLIFPSRPRTKVNVPGATGHCYSTTLISIQQEVFWTLLEKSLHVSCEIFPANNKFTDLMVLLQFSLQLGKDKWHRCKSYNFLLKWKKKIKKNRVPNEVMINVWEQYPIILSEASKQTCYVHCLYAASTVW